MGDSQQLQKEKYRRYRADLRVFGAIGFQDSPGNGLWLGKQRCRPQASLLARIVEGAIRKGVDAIGLTSEDKMMLPGSPEDRFGFIRKLAKTDDRVLDGSYSRNFGKFSYHLHEINPGIMSATRFEHGASTRIEKVYLVNCETMGPPEGQNWGGLKLHVVGGNLLRKNLDLKDAVNYVNDQRYMSFLIGVDPENQEMANRVIEKVTGVIGHDATNTFPDWMTYIPKIGPILRPRSRGRNNFANEYARESGKPSIAVSSAHWIHEIGGASIVVKDEGQFNLEDIRTQIEVEEFHPRKGHNNIWGVARFGWLINKYGGAPDRFAGDSLSSYN